MFAHEQRNASAKARFAAMPSYYRAAHYTSRVERAIVRDLRQLFAHDGELRGGRDGQHARSQPRSIKMDDAGASRAV